MDASCSEACVLLFFGVAEIKVTEFSSEEGLTLVYSWFIL
jgi:hypothetical protein